TALPDGGLLIVAAPTRDVEEATARLVRIVLLASGIALAVATAFCWWLIRQGLKPVDRMVDTASAIAAGDLAQRVPDPDPATELGRLGTALNEMLTQIEEAIAARAAGEQRLRRFVADAAHELRTPLTSLRGYAELYRQGALPDEPAVRNAMGRIESEGERMARLVDDLLLLARLDQSRALDMAPVDIVPIVREAIEAFTVVAPDRPVSTDLPERATVEGDRLRLRQIVDNLLSNVRTHTPAGTSVAVAVTTDNAQVSIMVSDTGPGIPEEDREHLFERFWRADRARTRSRGGTGLGLAIVQSLVEAHSGAIAVESQQGHGTTFTVTLPIAPTTGPTEH
ncbi:MAG: HAMP domain-containing histidine kinase, partial [Chloroflexota bacterium]|nr:HAMP domain-containing histidine kinase [Chloroflexota bacterium]